MRANKVGIHEALIRQMLATLGTHTKEQNQDLTHWNTYMGLSKNAAVSVPFWPHEKWPLQKLCAHSARKATLQKVCARQARVMRSGRRTLPGSGRLSEAHS